MDYKGVVFSDDLGMHAAKTMGNLKERTLKCLDAGCDLVLVCQPEDVAQLQQQIDGPVCDASGLISVLYGKPTLARGELLEVKEAGIRELKHWGSSLEKLGEQKWI